MIPQPKLKLRRNRTTRVAKLLRANPEVTFDEDVVSDEQQNNDDFEEPSEDEQSDQGEEAQEEQNND